MPRVIGIDPGTVSIDLCGLEDGTVFLDRSFPTAAALADPAAFVALLTDAGPLDLIAGPSGYGLPLVRAREATEEDLCLDFLAAEGEAGGIGGLRALARALAGSGLPVVLTPGVIHLTSVPEHRKVNRVDMGTADKVCVAALAIAERAVRTTRPLDEVSLVLLELGGAFTAVIAVAGGKIVDGAGGSAGPLGFRAAGALDGEVAYLAGAVSKAMLFTGGAASVAGWDDAEVVVPERYDRHAAVIRSGVTDLGVADTTARAGDGGVDVNVTGALDRVAHAAVVRVALARGGGAVQHARRRRRRARPRVRCSGVRGELRESPPRRG